MPKPATDKAKAKDKKAISDYLVTVGGLSRGKANQLAKVNDDSATNQDVANNVKDGLYDNNL